MQQRIVVIEGKSYRVTERKGILYIRKGIELPLEDILHAEKKLQPFAKNLTDLMRELLKGFCNSMGFGKQDGLIKDPGSLFDKRLSRHIQTAVYRALEEIAQCPVDVNEN